MRFNINFNVSFNIFLEQSSCAFIWANERRDTIKLHGGTVKIVCNRAFVVHHNRNMELGA